MDYVTKEIVLPVSGLTAVVQESWGDPERELYKRMDEIHKALPEYFAALTRRLGDNEKVTQDDILALRRPDYRSLALEIYRVSSLDDTITLTGDCRYCGKPAGYVVDMGGLSFEPLPDGVTGPDPVFEVVLPRTGSTVGFGYITGKQELEEADKPGFDLIKLAYRAVRTIDARPAKEREVAALPRADLRALIQAITSARCGYDTRVRFKHSCGKEVVMDLLTDPSFVMHVLSGLEG